MCTPVDKLTERKFRVPHDLYGRQKQRWRICEFGKRRRGFRIQVIRGDQEHQCTSCRKKYVPAIYYGRQKSRMVGDFVCVAIEEIEGLFVEYPSFSGEQRWLFPYRFCCSDSRMGEWNTSFPFLFLACPLCICSSNLLPLLQGPVFVFITLFDSCSNWSETLQRR